MELTKPKPHHFLSNSRDKKAQVQPEIKFKPLKIEDHTLIPSDLTPPILVDNSYLISIHMAKKVNDENGYNVYRYDAEEGHRNIPQEAIFSKVPLILKFGKEFSQDDLSFKRNRNKDNLDIHIKGPVPGCLTLLNFYHSPLNNSFFKQIQVGENTLQLSALISAMQKNEQPKWISSILKAKKRNGYSVYTYKPNRGYKYLPVDAITTDRPFSIIFAKGIKKSDLSFKRKDANLEINIAGKVPRRLTLTNYFTFMESMDDNNKKFSLNKFEIEGDTYSLLDIKLAMISSRQPLQLLSVNLLKYINPNDQGIYTYQAGDGDKYISYSANRASTPLTLTFGENITKDNLIFKLNDNNLEISFKDNDSDKLTLFNFNTKNNNFFFKKIKVGEDILLFSDLLSAISTNKQPEWLSNANILLPEKIGYQAVCTYKVGDGDKYIPQSVLSSPDYLALTFGEGINKDNLSFKRDKADLQINIRDKNSDRLTLRGFYNLKNKNIRTLSKRSKMEGEILQPFNLVDLKAAKLTDQQELSSLDFIKNQTNDDNNHYSYNAGDGQKYLSSDAINAPLILTFGEGINNDDLIFKYNNNNLEISIKGTESDRLTLLKFDKTNTLSSQKILAGGSILSLSDIQPNQPSAWSKIRRPEIVISHLDNTEKLKPLISALTNKLESSSIISGQSPLDIAQAVPYAVNHNPLIIG